MFFLSSCFGTIVKKPVYLSKDILFLNLLEKRLLLDTEQRVTATEALTYSYFKSLRDLEGEFRFLYFCFIKSSPKDVLTDLREEKRDRGGMLRKKHPSSDRTLTGIEPTTL